MSKEIQAVSDLRVKYIRGDRRQRENMKVLMQDDERNNEKKLPAAKRSCFRVSIVPLGVMYLLILAGIIIRYISVTLEKDQLQARLNDLIISYNHSQIDKKLLHGEHQDILDLKTEPMSIRYDKLNNTNTLLQDKHADVESRYNQSQAEVKQLQVQMKDAEVRYNQLQTSVKQLEAQHQSLLFSKSQLEKEVKLLQVQIEEMKDKYTQSENDVMLLRGQMEGKSCPNGFTRYGCSCYFKSTQKKTWLESRYDCQSRGSDLVIINSKDEQDFVSNLNMNEESWIGLHTVQTFYTYTWEWVDKSPLTETFWATGHVESPGAIYTAWCCNQHGKWTKSEFNEPQERNWICEK